jgi:hypothetical protein
MGGRGGGVFGARVRWDGHGIKPRAERNLMGCFLREQPPTPVPGLSRQRELGDLDAHSPFLQPFDELVVNLRLVLRYHRRSV